MNKGDDGLSTHELVSAAQTLFACNRYSDAERLLARASQFRTGSVEPLILLAHQKLLKKDLKAALVAYRTAVELAPNDLRNLALRREIALALYNAHYWEEASPLLKASAEAEPWDLRLADASARAECPSYLEKVVEDPLSGRMLQRYAPREGDSYTFVIEVAGTCNLRCPTCPVGNSLRAERSIGFMPLTLFEEILGKIRRETPAVDARIVLFNWGEPLLHPELPQFIAAIKREGFRSYLSSNLNIKTTLDDVIAADPTDFKISLSGLSQKTYERSHARGNFDLVLRNMHELSRLRAKYKSSTHIWVGHHIYRHNRHEAADVEKLCAQLGFEYQPIPAFYMPLERVVDLLDGKPSATDNGIVQELPVSPLERSELAASSRSGRFDCELRFNQTVINHDGTVALCCSVYDTKNMLNISFLEHGIRNIERMKYKHGFCSICFEKNLHYAPRELEPKRAFPNREPADERNQVLEHSYSVQTI